MSAKACKWLETSHKVPCTELVWYKLRIIIEGIKRLKALTITGVGRSRVARDESNVTMLIRSETVKVLKSSLMTFLDAVKVELSTCPVSRSTTKSLTTDTAVIYLHKEVITCQDVKKSGTLIRQVEGKHSLQFQAAEIRTRNTINTHQMIPLNLG